MMNHLNLNQSLRHEIERLQHGWAVKIIWRAFVVIISAIALLLWYGLASAAAPRLWALGWEFWKVVLVFGAVLAEIVLWINKDRRGLVYWLGVWIVAASAVERALPELIWEAVGECVYKVRVYARERVAGVLRSTAHEEGL